MSSPLFDSEDSANSSDSLCCFLEFLESSRSNDAVDVVVAVATSAFETWFEGEMVKMYKKLQMQQMRHRFLCPKGLLRLLIVRVGGC